MFSFQTIFHANFKILWVVTTGNETNFFFSDSIYEFSLQKIELQSAALMHMKLVRETTIMLVQQAARSDWLFVELIVLNLE